MPVEDQLFEVIPRLRTWAAAQEPVKRLWIYGSRLRGTQRPDSDLDIAIEIFARPTAEQRGQFWNHTVALWRADLRLIVPFEPHIEMYVTVWTNVNACSMLVFERRNSK
jgi:predicted nucleotidyltransferase